MPKRLAHIQCACGWHDGGWCLDENQYMDLLIEHTNIEHPDQSAVDIRLVFKEES